MTREQRANEIARAFRRVFASPDGQTVLAELRAKFGNRPRFSGDNPNALRAAVIDGQAQVILEIESAIEAGAKHTDQ